MYNIPALKEKTRSPYLKNKSVDLKIAQKKYENNNGRYPGMEGGDKAKNC